MPLFSHSKSKLTEKDVEEISKIINKEVARKVLDA